MEILYIFIIIALILASIISQNLQIKRSILTILLILFSLGAITQFMRVGFEKGLAGVLGMCLPAGITAYFLNKIIQKK
ncbi:hypothetical protein VB776_02420 [Arcicella sp. DC2W]|uniref:Uncharacterized protein n=1 Tax=Arcicella gelida TaxID=2984195 RepID=A0ABU5RZU0_9BACT|nr:hypothetical protein [Arcicella sp. DC2W]MEA5401752.1 hypothetical protein [Arcicella sp. DC2W]